MPSFLFSLNDGLVTGLSGKNLTNLTGATAFGSIATKLKLSKKLSTLSRIIVVISSASDMTGMILTKELYPQYFYRISEHQIIARFSPTACITMRYVDENTLEIWSNAQMVALGFPGTMYCAISGF